MKSLIDYIVSKFPEKYSQKRILYYFVTIFCFLGLIFGIYSTGRYIVPKFMKEGQEFAKRVINPKQSPKAAFDEFLNKTLGKWLFTEKYGEVGSEKYTQAMFDSGFTDNSFFEKSEQIKLVTDWKKGEFAEKIENILEKSALTGMDSVGKFVGETIPKLLYLPFQILLILLLSFFITIDIPKMKQGLRRLRKSRVQQLYDEIAPGLYKFGKLIGKSFQAQGIIAIINASLTYLFCIRLFHIEHEAFLTVVVFICSFIPVVGVVLSGVPIVMVAVTQDGGSFMTALWAVVAILLVHFAETSFFNPKVVGEILHLHPVLVLTILAISEHFFGVWGLLLGVPVAVYIIRVVILNEAIPGEKE